MRNASNRFSSLLRMGISSALACGILGCPTPPAVDAGQVGTLGAPCYGNNTCDDSLFCEGSLCTDVPPAGTLGGPCYGNETCDDSLFCIDDVCVDEPDAGNAEPDAGSNVADAGDNIVDAGRNVVDAGNNVVDAGNNVVDAGNNVVDAGNNIVVDAGNNVVDAGNNIVVDAGNNIVVDAGGNNVVDAGGNVVDAGGNNVVDAGGNNVDAGNNVVDAGNNVVDAGAPLCVQPAPTGSIGGGCVDDNQCTGGVLCQDELTTIFMVGQLTLGNAFGILAGVPDPANPGEFIGGPPSDVPLGFAPGGQCSNSCEPNVVDDGCGDCATCSAKIGPKVFDFVGIAARTFSSSLSNAQPGLCRQNCIFDRSGNTRGGCGEGYACDVASNVCLESCIDDAQCNVLWGVSRNVGLVAGSSTEWICNGNNGQCEKLGAPEEGVVNGPCVDDGDCSRNGVCQGGHCLIYGCATTGICDGTCFSVGGNGASACLATCESPTDCFSGQACTPLGIPSLPFGVCSAACADDSECKSTERCNAFGLESYPVCELTCDPSGDSCGDGKVCEPADSSFADPSLGFCRRQNQICASDDACYTGQACEVLGADLFGRCVDGCVIDADCDLSNNEECIVQSNSLLGICRRPGGQCSASPVLLGGDLQQPLLGDAQCVSSEECAQLVATDPATSDSCVPR